ncbi:hypothetical protein SAMN02745111_00206 [Eubacterium uniforme]|uniref:Uncharacterized protein n=1 Tax=Eubacterium uniforme TaxID=39495 RepID=A0A1T4V5L8_9FIRM|nr:hypothetical protein [Eubacterium uniforme]SKA60196.1 hypothetical protein SAMN02745111_00206 [Eubacterium uniforme]
MEQLKLAAQELSPELQEYIGNVKYVAYVFIAFAIVCFALHIKRRNDIKKLNGSTIKVSKDFVLKRADTILDILGLCIALAFVLIITSVMVMAFKTGQVDEESKNGLMIFSVVFFGIFYVVIFYGLINKIRIRTALSRGEFYIFDDEVGDKDVRHANNRSYYYLYLKKYYMLYKKRIHVSMETYRNTNVNDKCYVVYIPKTKDSYVFNQKYYSLDYDVQSKIIDVNELSNYDSKVKKKYVDLDNKYPGINNSVSEGEVLKDISKYYTNGLALFSIVGAVLVVVGMAFIIKFQILPGICLGGFGFLCIFAVMSNFKKAKEAKNNFLNGTYYIVPAVVVKDVSEMHLKDADKRKYLLTNKFGKMIVLPIEKFGNITTGSPLLLMFAHNDSENLLYALNPAYTYSFDIESKINPSFLGDVDYSNVNIDNMTPMDAINNFKKNL